MKNRKKLPTIKSRLKLRKGKEKHKNEEVIVESNIKLVILVQSNININHTSLTVKVYNETV